MTADEATEKLKLLQDEEGDWEIQHAMADEILVELLYSIGFLAVVEEYKKVPKWYS